MCKPGNRFCTTRTWTPAPVRAARTPKPKRSGVGYTVALAFFALVFVASAGALLSRLWQDKQTESEFTQLESLIAEPSTETVSVETTVDNATPVCAAGCTQP